MGHHLPGMIRAYSDRSLFARFRLRFLVAPVCILAVCVWATIYGIQAIQLVALVWGIWHGMMQTYGFCRIYDSKVAPGRAARARSDFWLCLVGFVTAVLLSPMRFRSLFELYYESGGPVVPAGVVLAIRAASVCALAAVIAWFLVQQFYDWRKHQIVSAVKWTLLASSLAFWWYCNNGVSNILVGIALFEVFHDVQYLAIVWIYNRTRVERDESIRGFMRFVFRRSGSLIGVYVGLVLAYGSIALTTSAVTIDWIRNALVGVVTASALLHFYYDGFIWKVRETETRSALGIGGPGIDGVTARRWFTPPVVHGLRWAALLLPFAVLSGVQLFGSAVPPIERTAKVAEVLPRDAQAQLNYGKALQAAGKPEQAIVHYKAAMESNPNLGEAESMLGSALSVTGDLDGAVLHCERALQINPKDARTEFIVAGILAAQAKFDVARAHYERSIALDSSFAQAHKDFADLLTATGEFDLAISHYNDALRLDPRLDQAREHLAVASKLAGR